MSFPARIETTKCVKQLLLQNYFCGLLVSIRRQKNTVAYSTNGLLNLRQRFLR